MARRGSRSKRSDPARGLSPAREAAGYRWSSSTLDVPLSHPVPYWEPVSVGQRPNLPSLRTVRGRLTRTSPVKASSFGPWALSVPVSERALECARRGIRREALFAKRLTGAGARARKNHFSNRSCK